MSEAESVSYLHMKVRFGEEAHDLRWEAFSQVLLRECRKAKLVADCGAEFGFYIHLIKRENPECRIVAFEPEPPRYEALASFFAGDERVRIHPFALTSSPGSIRIYKTVGRSASVDSRLSQWNVTEMHEIEVPGVTLDDMFRDEVPDIVKMDIEGAEVFALHGMERLLSTRIPVVFLEFHRKFVESLDPAGEERIIRLLRKHGYEIYNRHGETVDFSASRVILATPERAEGIEFDQPPLAPASPRSMDFSRKYSALYAALDGLRARAPKIVLYGNGSMGKTIRALLPDLVVATADASSDREAGPRAGACAGAGAIYAPSALRSFDFDFVLISVLGREDEIVAELIDEHGVSPQKILTFCFAESVSLRALGQPEQ